jgi:hypothetical protein
MQGTLDTFMKNVFGRTEGFHVDLLFANQMNIKFSGQNLGLRHIF